MTADRPPNPGSDAALDQGCRCSVMDNGRGLAAPLPPDDWYVSLDCPLHGHATAADNDVVD